MVARLIKGAAAAAKNRAKAAKNRAKAAADRAAKKAADAAKKAATSKPAIAAYGVTGGYQVGTASTLKSKTFSPRSRVNLGKGSPESSPEYAARIRNMRRGGNVN
jgi:membrane protein involved in colicin uptake